MESLLWIGFIVFVLIMLAIDLGVLNRKAHVITANEALIWTSLCVVLALTFNLCVYYIYENHVLGMGLDETGAIVKNGWAAATEFFTGYIIEQSLSLDNVFVIALIFSYFAVEAKFQHRVLFWGIVGALIMRGAMIGVGATLIERFEWMTYVFGAILIFTAIKMLMAGDEKVEPDKNPLVRAARKIFPVTPTFEGEKFFTRIDGRRAITPLFLVLLVVESTDLLFAVDSIPAIFAITHEPFIVFTSNIFAILGLRSLYFLLAAAVGMFRYLKVSLVFVLAFVGGKMLGHHYFPVATGMSLLIVLGILAVGVIASLLASHHKTAPIVNPVFQEIGGAADYTIKHLRRGFIFLIGATVILIGIAMIVLPGPAIVVIPAGVGILATEFVWAKKLLKSIRTKARAVAQKVGLPDLPGLGKDQDGSAVSAAPHEKNPPPQ